MEAKARDESDAVDVAGPFAKTSDLSWKDFLTPRDRAYLASTNWTKTEPFGLGERPAVLVVDDYYEALGDERLPILESLVRWPKSCGDEGWDAIDRTVELLTAARDNDIPIVYVTKWDGFEAPWGRRGTRGADRPSEMDRLSGEIVKEIAPLPGDLVLHKVCPSAFQGTPLLNWLNYHRIDTLLVTGESTSGCVRATVVDAASQRFHVGVVEPCCFDRLQSSHWISLFDMNQKYADVIDLANATEYLVAQCSARA